ncbi:hypothetical protein SAMN05442782_0021 [Streptomyces sp. OK228]|nr:hypothetical protein SAMN05442782_0021 [Streptomyces sp. OK228]
MSHNATFLQAAQASQGAPTRGWLTSPAPSADAPYRNQSPKKA